MIKPGEVVPELEITSVGRVVCEKAIVAVTGSLDVGISGAVCVGESRRGRDAD